MPTAVEKAKRVVYSISKGTNYVGVSAMLLMVLLVVADVLSRWLFNKPFGGSYELVELGMVLAVAFSLSYTQTRRGHVNVTMLVERFPKKIQSRLTRIASFMSLCMYLLIFWQALLKGRTETAVGTTSAVLFIPIYPFVYVAALGFLLLCLVFLVQLLIPDE